MIHSGTISMALQLQSMYVTAGEINVRCLCYIINGLTNIRRRVQCANIMDRYFGKRLTEWKYGTTLVCIYWENQYITLTLNTWEAVPN